MSGICGDLLLIEGEVYVEQNHPSFAWRYVGELEDRHAPSYCTHIFRSCRSGKLRAMPYTQAERQLQMFSR